MKLAEILSALPKAETKANIELDIKDLAYHSHRVKDGCLFVCIKGFKTDGHLYARWARQSGAAAFVVERWLSDIPEDLQILVPNSRQTLALLANILYNHPTQRLQLIGITGTNGKTTTAFLLDNILRTAGRKTGLIGTVEYKIGDEHLPVERTTPESLELQCLFGQMVQAGVDSVIMEVSSHAIDLARVTGCQYDAIVFTNLSQDHLDYHQTLEDYFQVKSRLFKNDSDRGADSKRRYVINADDIYGQRLIEMLDRAGKSSSVYLYGLNSSVDIIGRDVKLSDQGTFFQICTPAGNLFLKTQLKGLFNVYNSLAAAGVAISLGLPLEIIKNGLEGLINIPGRYETVDCGQDFDVVVDYAHTPDSLRNVLETAKSISKGRVITVFGCGGNRDKEKRSLMGAVAAKLSDFSIITSDNPRNEDPASIISQIEEGFKQRLPQARYKKVLDRKDAIFQAIALAKEGDTIIIAGKGHEKEQIFANQTIPFEDRQVVVEALRSIQNVTSESF